MDDQEFSKIFPNNFKDLPHPFKQVKNQLIDRILHTNLDAFYGLTPQSPAYRVFHATVDTKLVDIADKGLRAFFEQERESPRIFVTPSPTLALWHAIENKPHDTLRSKGVLPESVASGKPILLQLQIDKQWLSRQDDLRKPLDPTEYLRLLGEEEVIGTRQPEQLNRLATFHDVLQVEVNGLKQGKEVTEFGIQLPVDHVPSHFIFVESLNSTIPIQEWVKAK